MDTRNLGVKFAVAPGACRPYSEIFAVISEKIRFSVLIGLKTHLKLTIVIWLNNIKETESNCPDCRCV